MALVRAIAAWSARPWRRSSSSGRNSRGVAYETASVPITSPAGARSGAAAMARSWSRSAAMSSSGSCGIRGSFGVVVGPDRPDLLGREAVDPAAERELHSLEPRFGVGVHPAGDDHGHEVGPVVGHPGEVGAVRGEEAPRLLDDAGEELARVAQRRDPRRDVAERSLGLGPRLQLALGLLQLVDQAGVEHRDRRLVGERAEEVRLVRAEGPRASGRRPRACRAPRAPRRAGRSRSPGGRSPSRPRRRGRRAAKRGSPR